MNTTEKSILISEFMGLIPISRKDFENCPERYNIKTHSILEYQRYHLEWNWLMEVVEKIESLGSCQIDISSNWCRIGYKDTLFNYDSRDYFKNITKIEAVYNACISFIEWYNKQK